MCLPEMTILIASYDLHSCSGHILNSPIPTGGTCGYWVGYWPTIQHDFTFQVYKLNTSPLEKNCITFHTLLDS